MQTTSTHPRGFSLVELLIVIAIIGALAALLLPVLESTKASVEAGVCKSNLRQCYAATMAYSNEWKGLLPMTLVASGGSVASRWGQYIAPFMDHEGTGNLAGRKNWVPPAFRCRALNRAFPSLMSASFGQVSAFGYVRNDRLYYDNSSNSLKQTSDWSNSTWPGVGGVPFLGFRFSRITHPSRRLFAGDGFTISAGGGMEAKFHSSGNTTLSSGTVDLNGSVTGIGFFYSYQWNRGNSGIPFIAAAKDPNLLNKDVHRGNRSYLMCDGSTRSLSDDYRDPSNGVFLAMTDPAALP